MGYLDKAGLSRFWEKARAYMDTRFAGMASAASALPPGGTTGQVPVKASDADYDVQWQDPPQGDGMPSGSILMWHGTVDTVPEGWAVCDGQNGTPDLRGKFMLCADDGHAAGGTGGQEEVTLTIEQMPRHYHRVYGIKHTLSESASGTVNYVETPASPTNASYAVYWEGSSQPHTNMPPYYAILFIMKL